MSSPVQQLRDRLARRRSIQRQLLEMREWMQQRGETHDLVFLRDTESYVRWLDEEIADVDQRLKELGDG